MNDNFFKKIKVISNFISFYKTFFFISAVATVLISYLMQSLFDDDKYFVNNFIENWNKKPIRDVKFTNNECETGYNKTNLGSWPISTTICDCSESTFYSGGKDNVKPYPCSYLLQFLGCVNSEQVTQIDINKWKGNNICIKRQETTYLEQLIKHDSNTCNCTLTDSLNKKICLKECPKSNDDIYKFSLKSQKINQRILFKNKIKLANSNANAYRINNLTTYSDIERIFKKDFNMSYNNFVIQNFGSSDLFIAEHFPCLIPTIIQKQNQVNRLFEFVLENIEYIKSKNKPINSLTSNSSDKLLNLPASHENGEYLYNIMNSLNLQTLDQKNCYLYENTYFDRRHYIVDLMNFYQFLLADMNEPYFKMNNLTLSYEEISDIDNFTPSTTMFLVSAPFYGWNYKLCPENPKLRMHRILDLYDKSWNLLTFIVLLKLVCFIYLTLYGIFEKFYAESKYASYIINIDESKNNHQIIFDVIYYFINLIGLCCLLENCFTLKNLTTYQYLNIIKNDCMDDNSTKIITYLYDVCEEKFIYSVFILTLNAIEFIFFNFIFKSSYELRLLIIKY